MVNVCVCKTTTECLIKVLGQHKQPEHLHCTLQYILQFSETVLEARASFFQEILPLMTVLENAVSNVGQSC